MSANPLETEFASQRFSQRTARDRSQACAVEHYRPERWAHVSHALRIIICLAGAALLGWFAGHGV